MEEMLSWCRLWSQLPGTEFLGNMHSVSLCVCANLHAHRIMGLAPLLLNPISTISLLPSLITRRWQKESAKFRLLKDLKDESIVN